ncbi:MAG: Crp/Fnr family transcriptional regulator [Pseudomonadota bacterium]
MKQHSVCSLVDNHAIFFCMVASFNSYAAGVMDLLSPETREALLASGTRVQFSDGQLLQTRGNIAVDLGFVLKGHIRMMTIGADGSETLTAILGPGQQINEVTLFAGAARTHDAIAVGETELLTLTPDEYHRFAENHPEIVQALLISNVHRVHQLVEMLNDLRGLPKSVVLARTLLKNAKHKRKSPEQTTVQLDVSQEDISMFLGVSRAYLNKVLGQLGELGLIELSYRKVIVRDLPALESWIEDNLTYEMVEGRGLSLLNNADKAS